RRRRTRKSSPIRLAAPSHFRESVCRSRHRKRGRDRALVARRKSDRRTRLVALKGTDGLVLAADSRGTFGEPSGTTAQNDSQQKAHILAPHVAVLTAGSGEVGALIIDEALQTIEQQGLDGVTPVMEVLAQHVRQRF